MKEILKTIVKNRDFHAKWLNTLSHLEYIGTRKIIKSQLAKNINYETLKHIQEESRHALFFKRILVKKFENLCPSYSVEFLLGGKSGENYFQELDTFVNQQLKNEKSDLTYFYVTLLIEERALKLYELYNQVLVEEDAGFNLNSLIKEEVNHLQDTQAALNNSDPLFQERIVKFRNKEDDFFHAFIKLISTEIHPPSKTEEHKHAFS